MVEKIFKVLKTTLKLVLVIGAVLTGIAFWQGWSMDDIKEKLRSL